MASRVQNLFSQTYTSRQTISREANTFNKDGYPAFTLPLEEQYLQMLMTNTLGNTYYASSRELLGESQKLHEKMLRYDPYFMAKAIVYARNNGYMRLQPIYGLVYLTKDTKGLAAKIFNKVIRTPRDLEDFVTLLPQVRRGKGLGSSIKRMINTWLNRMSEYHGIKYGATHSSKVICGKCGVDLTSKKGHISKCPKCWSTNIRVKTFWSLPDIIKVTHPKPIDTTQGNLFQYIIHGIEPHEKWGTVRLDLLPQIKCLEMIKHITKDYKEGKIDAERYYKFVTKSIEEGKLPYEVVTGIIEPTKQMWVYLMKQMPIFALLRHLNTLQRHGVFDDHENVSYAVSRLTNVNAIRKSMLWPNRIATAYKNWQGGQQIRDALRDMAEIALDNVPTIPGTTAVFLDISGSMSGEFKQHGAMLGLGAMKASNRAEFWCFGSQLWYPNVSTRDFILSNMDRVTAMDGGGTNTAECINHLLGQCKENRSNNYWSIGGYHRSVPQHMRSHRPIDVDNIIILTDEQQNAGAPVVVKFREYRKRVNPNANLFIIDVAPYQSHITPGHEPNVHFIFGWSDEILKYISFVVNGIKCQVDAVASMSLD